jgi:hypothetical protein
MFQSEQGLVQATYQVGVSWIREPCGLTAENNLTEGAMEEGVLQIEMMNGQSWETAIASIMRTMARFTTGLEVSS